MVNQARMEILGDNVDRLITVEMRAGPGAVTGEGGGTAGATLRTYEAARKKVGRPLSLSTAEALVKAVKPGDTVIISAGFCVPFWYPKGECCGPPGSVALARAIRMGQQGKTLFLSEEPVVSVIESTCSAVGLRTFKYEDFRRIPLTTSVRSFPIDENKAKKEASILLDDLNPSAVITIERCSRNDRGVWHTGLGTDMSSSTAKVDYLIDMARDRGILTIGIGDLGNEIGMAKIADSLKGMIRYGSKCRCGCGGGIVAATETDYLVYASASNFGAYGTIACLSALLENPDVLHSADEHLRLLEGCTCAGGMDSQTVSNTLTEDGVPVRITMHLIDILHFLAKVALQGDYPAHKVRHDFETYSSSNP